MSDETKEPVRPWPLGKAMHVGSWPYKAVAATHGQQSKLGTIVLAMLDKNPAHGPAFEKKATITSDGFVIAGFRDRSGEYHSGAFVCDVEDLTRNFRGLADHLKLSDKDREEMFATVKAWIATDYRAKSDLFE